MTAAFIIVFLVIGVLLYLAALAIGAMTGFKEFPEAAWSFTLFGQKAEGKNVALGLCALFLIFGSLNCRIAYKHLLPLHRLDMARRREELRTKAKDTETYESMKVELNRAAMIDALVGDILASPRVLFIGFVLLISALIWYYSGIIQSWLYDLKFYMASIL